jgi:hypothetical protein
MNATSTKQRAKKPQITTGPNLETVEFEAGVHYLTKTYGMRRDDAEHYLQQIKDSAERYQQTTA